jgi:hypothetical protein
MLSCERDTPLQSDLHVGNWRCAGQILFLGTLVACIHQDQWVSSRGRVVDRQKGTPIAAAVVRFYGSHMPDTGISVSTDSAGRFRVFYGVSTFAQLESLSVEAPRYPLATFQPEVRGVHLPPVEIQLAGPSAQDTSRILSVTTEVSNEEPAH